MLNLVFPYNSQRKLDSKAILDVPASLDPKTASDRRILLLALVVDTERGEQETPDPILTAGLEHMGIAQNVIASFS